MTLQPLYDKVCVRPHNPRVSTGDIFLRVKRPHPMFLHIHPLFLMEEGVALGEIEHGRNDYSDHQ